MTVPAKYENGVFKPLATAEIKEGTIVTVHVPHQEKVKPRSIRDLGFAGMWAYYDDIADGLGYLNELRALGNDWTLSAMTALELISGAKNQREVDLIDRPPHRSLRNNPSR